MKALFGWALLLSACDDKPRPARSGPQVYDGSCSVCHQRSGQGSALIPPLAGSEWVVGDSNTLIRVVMHGMTGKITVNGKVYNNVMSPMGITLTDQELANVLTHIRSSWGNDAKPITVDAVSQIRSAHPNQRLWTVDTLPK